MRVRVLGAHNTESRRTRLVSLLVDDILAIDAGALASTLSFSAQQKIRAVLLTHHHYDHIRDIPALAMNAYLRVSTIQVYSIPSVYDVLTTHLLDGNIYPDFLRKPPEKPTIDFIIMEPNQSREVEGYDVLATPVSHSVPAVGYQVTSPDGKALFFTGDAGPGLAECWKRVSPHLLVIEVTAPNSYEQFARQSLHLTPGLLKAELESFRRLKGYLPQVVTIHMNPTEEKTIAGEVARVAEALDATIMLAHEGMVLNL